MARVQTFGRFRIDPVRGLVRGSAAVRLPPRAFQVLLALLERAGEVVDKSDLLERVWAGGAVGENNLSQAIRSLRRALGDSRKPHRLIETIPARGYRVFAPQASAPADPEPDPQSPARSLELLDREPRGLLGRTTYRFGPFSFDPRQHRLSRGLEPVRLPFKALDLLAVFVRRPGDLLSKGDLMEAVWPDVNVEEGNLAVNVCLLRKALGEQQDGDRFILTIPGRGYRFCVPVVETAAPSAAALTPLTGSFPSVAVPPFRVAGRTRRGKAAGVALADAVASALAREGLAAPRGAAAVGIPASDGDPLEAAMALGAQWLVAGALRAGARRLRLDVQLVRVSDGFAAWSQRFDEPARRRSEAGIRIASGVARGVAGHLRVAGRRPLARAGTSRAAWEACLRGRHVSARRTQEALRLALRWFERALLEDPDYAPAYAGMADTYTLLTGYGGLAGKEGYARARAWARKAVEHDGNLAECHTALGYAALAAGDLEQAAPAFRRSLALDPAYATTYHWYADYLLLAGRTPEALDALRRARDLDPLSHVIAADLGRAYLLAGDHDRAVTCVEGALELDPSFVNGHWILGQALARAGRMDLAVRALRRGRQLSPENELVLGSLTYALGVAGRTADAVEAFQCLEGLARRRHVDPYWLALGRLGLHQPEAAIRSLERAEEEGSYWALYRNVEPTLAPLHSERSPWR